MSGILFRVGDADWAAPTESGYASESELEEMIKKFPQLLPGVSPNSLVISQFATDSGPLDLLVIDAADGSITIVECKLASNQEIRRKIVGQIIDYAASIRSLSFDDFHRRWLAGDGDDLEGILIEDMPLSQIVAKTIKEGRFTLVMAVDVINEPLKQMVLYLNEKTDASTRVALIELGRHKANNTEFLIPQTFGYEVSKPEIESYSARRAWTQDDYFQWVQTNEPSSEERLKALVAKLEKKGFLWIGTKSATPSGAMRYPDDKKWFYLFSFHTNREATIEITFGDMLRFSFLEQILVEFNQVPDIDQVTIRARNFSIYPKIPLRRLSDPAVENALLGASEVVLSHLT